MASLPAPSLLFSLTYSAPVRSELAMLVRPASRPPSAPLFPRPVPARKLQQEKLATAPPPSPPVSQLAPPSQALLLSSPPVLLSFSPLLQLPFSPPLVLVQETWLQLQLPPLWAVPVQIVLLLQGLVRQQGCCLLGWGLLPLLQACLLSSLVYRLLHACLLPSLMYRLLQRQALLLSLQSPSFSEIEQQFLCELSKQFQNKRDCNMMLLNTMSTIIVELEKKYNCLTKLERETERQRERQREIDRRTDRQSEGSERQSKIHHILIESHSNATIQWKTIHLTIMVMLSA